MAPEHGVAPELRWAQVEQPGDRRVLPRGRAGRTHPCGPSRRGHERCHDTRIHRGSNTCSSARPVACAPVTASDDPTRSDALARLAADPGGRAGRSSTPSPASTRRPSPPRRPGGRRPRAGRGARDRGGRGDGALRAATPARQGARRCSSRRVDDGPAGADRAGQARPRAARRPRATCNSSTSSPPSSCATCAGIVNRAVYEPHEHRFRRAGLLRQARAGAGRRQGDPGRARPARRRAGGGGVATPTSPCGWRTTSARSSSPG